MESTSYSDIEQKYQKLLQLEPKLITSTVPENAQEQKKLFIADDIVIPAHVYPKLAIKDEVVDNIQKLGDSITTSPACDKKQAEVYEGFVDAYVDKTRLMQAMDAVKTAESDELRDQARKEFMERNVELYGAPDHDTYVSLLSEKIAVITGKDLSDSARSLLDDLGG